MIELTHSKWINKKYTEFYEKYGYIPRLFNPWNLKEITTTSNAITTNIGSGTGISDVLIIEKWKE